MRTAGQIEPVKTENSGCKSQNTDQCPVNNNNKNVTVQPEGGGGGGNSNHDSWQ